MSRIRVKTREIQIKRNSIEDFLLFVRDVIKNHRRIILYSLIGFLCVIIVVIVFSLYFNSVANEEQAQYERLMSKYYSTIANGEGETLQTIGEFSKLIDSAHNSFLRNNGSYILGNMYFSQKMYKDAKVYLLKYVNDSPETELTPLALLKAAVASEELNDFNGAFSLLRKLEQEYKDSIIADQIYYHMARYYVGKNDLDKAKNYFEREITSYPMSPYALMAKMRLLFLNSKK